MITDFHRSAMIGVRGNHGGLGPIQVPSVLDGENGVGAGDNILQIKRTVEIALIAAEKIAVLLRIFWDQYNHGSSEGFAGSLRGPFDIQAAACQG
jgi:hypothetical protein